MDVRRRVFPITRSICLGPFASPERLETLVSEGVTHILNVGEAESVLTASDGPFREVAWHPIVDLEAIPAESAIGCLRVLHRMVSEPGARVYVHCLAGQNRSPTVVWLYLIACGVLPAEAKSVIECRAWDAVPGHKRLVEAGLIETVKELGRHAFLPHPRPGALEPAQV